MKSLAHLVVLAATAAAAAPAMAQDAGPICTDRPTKSNAVCTVPAGHWQLEADLGNYTRHTVSGARSETTYLGNTYLKYGLTDRFDLQVNWAPYIRAENRDAAGVKTSDTGAGDLYLRLKGRAYMGEKVNVSLIPYVKAPVASRGFGNDRWEGGLAAPVSFALPQGFTLLLGPQLDLLTDADGSGRHVALTNLVNVSRPVSDRITLAGELWASQNFDPAGTIRQYSADVAAMYLVTPTLQLDLGANFGLNRATPDTQAYVGVSTRF